MSTCSGHPQEELTPKTKVAEEKGKNIDEAGPSEKRVYDEPKEKPPPPFQQKIKKQNEEECFGKFIKLLKYVHINLPLINVLQGITKYPNMLKILCLTKVGWWCMKR